MENLDNLKQLIQTVKVKEQIDQKNDWSNGSETYFEEMQKEIQETLVEYKSNKQVYLEDELGDILWDYLNLLTNLEKENKIESIEKIFQRANKKYTQRVTGIQNGTGWDKVKQIQKQELKQEQENLENN